MCAASRKRVGRHRDAGLLLDLAGRRLRRGFALLDVAAERDDLPGAEARLLVPEQNLGFAVAGGPGQQAQAASGCRGTRILSQTPERATGTEALGGQVFLLLSGSLLRRFLLLSQTGSRSVRHIAASSR